MNNKIYQVIWFFSGLAWLCEIFFRGGVSVCGGGMGVQVCSFLLLLFYSCKIWQGLSCNVERFSVEYGLSSPTFLIKKEKSLLFFFFFFAWSCWVLHFSVAAAVLPVSIESFVLVNLFMLAVIQNWCFESQWYQTSDWVQSKINFLVGIQESLLATVKSQIHVWLGHVTFHNSLSKNHPSGHLGGWAALWSEELLNGQHQSMDVPAHARTVHDGLLQKQQQQNGVEEDLCLTIPHVPLMTQLLKGVNWTDRINPAWPVLPQP